MTVKPFGGRSSGLMFHELTMADNLAHACTLIINCALIEYLQHNQVTRRCWKFKQLSINLLQVS